jgi:tetratricopeptide (TPR) repeat protein
MRIAAAVGDPFVMMDAYNAVGGLYVHQGDLHKAIPILERGLELCQVWNIPLGIPRTASFLGMAYVLSGRVSEAIPLLEEAVEGVPSKNIRRDHPLWVIHLSQTYLLAGRIGKASTLVWRAFELSQAHQEQGHQVYALQLLGEIHRHRCAADNDHAAHCYHQALTLAEELGIRPLLAHCHLGLGRLSYRMGRAAEARHDVSAAVDLYREMDMTSWLEQAETALTQAQ